MQLILIGYRGTGKTTTAEQLAERLGWDFVDLDDEIEEAAGKSIAAIFTENGEQTFRDLETSALVSLIGRERIVIAAGGGTVLREDNRQVLNELGYVVWLQADIDTILDRVQSDGSTSARRPNLTTRGGRAEIEMLLAQRHPLYAECADLEINTVGKSPSEVAEEIMARFPLAGDPA